LAVGAGSAVTLSAGRYYQAPSFIWLVGDPDNERRLRPIRADQVVVGYEHLLRPDLKFQLEGFFKRYTSYPVRLFRPQAVLAPAGFETATLDIPFGLEPLASEGTGRSYGLELFIQKRLSAVPLYGLLSASVSRAEFAALDGETRVGSFDARFVGNLLVGYRPSRDWDVSGKLRVATGLPTTPFIDDGPLAGQLDFTRYNAGVRLPTFHAFDIRIDRRWSFRKVQLETYLDIQNVYGRSNVSRYRWNSREQVVEADESLGILPTIGVNIEF
jgi:hypothetical protein